MPRMRTGHKVLPFIPLPVMRNTEIAPNETVTTPVIHAAGSGPLANEGWVIRPALPNCEMMNFEIIYTGR